MDDQPKPEDDATNISKMPDETKKEPNIDTANVADAPKSEITENKAEQQSTEPSGAILPSAPNRITFIDNNPIKALKFIPPIHNYTINLVDITTDEEKMLKFVMEKDDAFLREIGEKVRILKQEIQMLRNESSARLGETNTAYTSRMCIRCRRKYGIWREAVPLVEKGMICQRCKFRVCKTCSHKQANGLWLCTLCVRYREIQILTGSWVCMGASGLSGTELLKISFMDTDYYRTERVLRAKRRSTKLKQSVSLDAEKRDTQVSPSESPRRSSRSSRRHSSKRISKRQSKKSEGQVGEEGGKKGKKKKSKKDKKGKKDKKSKKGKTGKKDKKGKKDDKKGKQKGKKKDGGKGKSKKGKDKGGKGKKGKGDKTKKHGKSKQGKKGKKKSGKNKSKNADNKLANTNISRHGDDGLESQNSDINDFEDSQANALASKSGLILQRKSRSRRRRRARTCDQHLRWQDESKAIAFLGDSTYGPHDESVSVDASDHSTVLQKKTAHEHRSRKPSSIDVTEMDSGDHKHDQTRQARRHRQSYSHRTENYNHHTDKFRRRAHDTISSDCLLNENKESHNSQHSGKLSNDKGRFPVEVIPSVSRINLLQTNSSDEERVGKKRISIENLKNEVSLARSQFADAEICLKGSSGNSYKIQRNSDVDMQTVTVLQPSSNCHEETYTLNTEAPDGEWEKQCCELENKTADRLKGSYMSIFEPKNFRKEFLSENETRVGDITLYTTALDNHGFHDISKENCAPSFCDKSDDLLAGEDHQIDETLVLSMESNCITSANTKQVSPTEVGQNRRVVGSKNIVSRLRNSKIISRLRNSKIVSNLKNSSIFKGKTSQVPPTETRQKERVFERQETVSSLRNNNIVFSLRNSSIFKRMTSPLANIFDYNSSALRIGRFGRINDRNGNYKVHKIATYQEYQQPQQLTETQMMAEQQMAEKVEAPEPVMMKQKPKFNLGEVLLKAKRQQLEQQQQEQEEQKQMFEQQKQMKNQIQKQQQESTKKRQITAKRMHALNFSKESQTEQKRSLASKWCPFCKFSIEIGVR